MKNYKLGRRVLEYIEAHPEEHDQRDYGHRDSCGTRACIAGHTLLQAGYDLRGVNFYGKEYWDKVIPCLPWEKAAELLGLTTEEETNPSRGLFSGLLSERQAIAKLREMVERAEREAGELV